MGSATTTWFYDYQENCLSYTRITLRHVSRLVVYAHVRRFVTFCCQVVTTPSAQAAIATGAEKREARMASPSATRSDLVLPFIVCSLFKDHFYQRSACLLTTYKSVKTCHPHFLVVLDKIR